MGAAQRTDSRPGLSVAGASLIPPQLTPSSPPPTHLLPLFDSPSSEVVSSNTSLLPPAHRHKAGLCGSPSPGAPSSSGLGSSSSSSRCGGGGGGVNGAADYSAEDKAARQLKVAAVLCFVFFIIELVGGLISGSLAILSDSFHLLSDLSGFLISIFAIYLSRRKATKRHSFGFHRAEIIGALISVLSIWVVTGMLVLEAINRIRNPQEIDSTAMCIVAVAGVIVNFILAFALGHGHGHGHSHGHSHGHEVSNGESSLLRDQEPSNAQAHRNQILMESNQRNAVERSSSPQFVYRENENENSRHSNHHHHHGQNINVRSAMIHVIGDLFSSIGVLIASIIIMIKPQWSIVDPICTFIFSVIVLFTTVHLMKDSVLVLMESTPGNIDPHDVEADLLAVPHVTNVHDLHIWTLTIGKAALAVHIEVDDLVSISEYRDVLAATQNLLCSKYGVHHTTVQVESGSRLYDAHCISSLCNGGVCNGVSTSSFSDVSSTLESSSPPEHTPFIRDTE